MNSKKTLVILFGGVSSEHDASKKSFEHVLERLSTKRITSVFAPIKIVYISRNGQVLVLPYEQKKSAEWYFRKTHNSTLINLFAHLRSPEVFTFSILHGQHGEDGCIQGLAKFLDIKGSFGGVLATALAMSKSHCNTFVSGLSGGINIPRSITVSFASKIDKAISVWEPGEKIVVKPSSLGASILTELYTVGVDDKKISSLLKKILAYDATALMQEFIAGDEYSCGCLEHRGTVSALPLIKIITKQQFFGHKEKHVLGKNEEKVIAVEEEKTVETKIKSLSEKLFCQIGLSHIARFDFRVTPANKLYFLEVNPLPGMMKNSLFPKMLRSAGKNIEDVILLSYHNTKYENQKETEFHYHID